MIGGSPHTNADLEDNSQIIMAHRLALISDRLYEVINLNIYYYIFLLFYLLYVIIIKINK